MGFEYDFEALDTARDGGTGQIRAGKKVLAGIGCSAQARNMCHEE
jgi:hypothetical protein